MRRPTLTQVFTGGVLGLVLSSIVADREASAQSAQEPVVRLAELEIDPTQLDRDKAFLREVEVDPTQGVTPYGGLYSRRAQPRLDGQAQPGAAPRRGRQARDPA